MITARLIAVGCLQFGSGLAMADVHDEQCFRDEVVAHVIQQFALYGPKSARHEYFGFIYLYGGIVESAVARSSTCRVGNCTLDTGRAAREIPRGAKILGEWHTHPHDGSDQLSTADVRGAHANNHLRCYAPFYSKPNGEIHYWDPGSTSVPTALASRVALGAYVRQPQVRYASAATAGRQ